MPAPVFSVIAPKVDPRARFARLSTGTKMLLILTAALLPLGLIALFASIQSDRAKRAQREADAQVVATAEARQIDILLLRGSNILRAMLARPELAGVRCEGALARNAAAFPSPIRLALVAPDGRVRCATPGFGDAGEGLRPTPGLNVAARLLTAPDRLRFATVGPDGSYGVGELPEALLRQAMPAGDRQSIVLLQDHTSLRLASFARSHPIGRHLVAQVPVASGQATLKLTLVMNPVSAVELLLVVLPLLMWAAAAVIGWVVVDHLLLRPLAQLQRAVTAFRPGHGALDLPPITTPAHEIGDLAAAFAETAVQLAEHEAALEEGLSRQVRLTREVHHRVKNNLQVVASLINLHARGSDGEVAGAYAAIQRRVDALAVVHRNHYAELEENHGVALRSIVAELTANLRATAPPAASQLAITLDMAPASVTQDVAVPVAFLITEVVELAMACDPSGAVAISLKAQPDGSRARLSISAPGLTQERCAAHPTRERYQRIVTGLARQLRAPLDYNPETGCHAIAIATLPPLPEVGDAAANNFS